MTEQQPRSIVERIDRREFVTSIQIDPPGKRTGVADLLAFTDALRAQGWDIFDVNSTRRNLAMSGMAIAERLRLDGCSVIPHVTARDALTRSIVADVRSAYELFGVRDVLVIRGDVADGMPPIANEAIRPAGGVYEHDVPALVDRIARDVRGEGGAADLRIGVAYTLPPPHDACVVRDAKDPADELDRLRAKFDAGADFVMTQTIFQSVDWERAREVIDRNPALRDRRYLVGLWPIFDEATLRLLTETGCSGVFFPRSLRELYARCPVEAWGRMSMEVCAATIRQLRNSGTVSGVYIVTPFRKGLWGTFTELITMLPR